MCNVSGTESSDALCGELGTQGCPPYLPCVPTELPMEVIFVGFFPPQMALLTVFKVPMQSMVLGERKDEGEGSQRYSETGLGRHLEVGPLQKRSLGSNITG